MFELFLAELRVRWIEFSRYPLEVVSGAFVYTFVFYGLFLSAQYIAGPSFGFGDRLESIVIGYVLWTLVSFILGSIAANLQQEAQTGTLEQIFLSRYPAIQVFLMRALASLSLQLLMVLSILLVLIVLTGSHLSFSLLLILPFATVLLGAYGFAFMVGALALLFKRVQQLLGLLQLPLLFLLTLPTESWSGLTQVFADFLPMTTGAGLLRNLMARGEGLDFTRLGIAFVNGAVYFTIGLLFFLLAERQAKRRGILSGY